MPQWVTTAFQEYRKRLPPQCALELVEIRAAKRSPGAEIQRAVNAEGEALLGAIKDHDLVIALDHRGRQWDTGALARQLADWLQDGRDVALVVGGPDGLAESVRTRAHRIWSLSELTLPHPLVRVVVAEQIYRAWSVLQGSPYHRND